MHIIFEWDEQKAKSNIRKHGVSFDEAKAVFMDPFSITIPDPDYTANEERFVDIGSSVSRAILVVVYAERDASIRIISCRKATPSERRSYEKGYDQEVERNR